MRKFSDVSFLTLDLPYCIEFIHFFHFVTFIDFFLDLIVAGTIVLTEQLHVNRMISMNVLAVGSTYEI